MPTCEQNDQKKLVSERHIKDNKNGKQVNFSFSKMWWASKVSLLAIRNDCVVRSYRFSVPLTCTRAIIRQKVYCREQWSWVDRAGDTVKQSQRRVTQQLATVIEACLLTNRSKMFRQHLKCSLTAPRRAGTSSGFFFLVSFNSASCLSLGDLVQRCLGQPVDLLAPWPSAAVIPRRRSTAVHFQCVERRVQRNLEGLANVRFDELTVVRRHWLFF